jgi:hypothetical protein
MAFQLTPVAFSYTMITDPNVFYSFFEKPKKVIEFRELRDGTSYEDISQRLKPNTFYAAQPNCLIVGTGDDDSIRGLEALAVRPNAFSKSWSFMGADPKRPNSLCRVVIWFDQGISTGNFNMTVATTTGRSQPFVLFTNRGFMGILPDTPEETLFIFDNLHLVFSFETEFSKTTPVAESEALFWAIVE